MTRTRVTRETPGLLLLILLIGCGRSQGLDPLDGGPADSGRGAGGRADGGAPDAGPADAGPADAGPIDAGPADGGALWPVGATRIDATASGGFGLFTCVTDAGNVNGSTYVLTLPGGQLEYVECRYPDVATGSLTLDAGQLAQFDAAMRALVPGNTTACGADKPDEVLLLTTPTGQLRYEDDFYACVQNPGTVYVGNIDGVFGLLASFSP